MTERLGYEKNQSGEKETENRRNGASSKTLRTNHGSMEIEIPRDRNGGFEPRIIPEHQREWRGFDEKILSTRGLGLSTKAIQDHLKDIYNVDVSPELISGVTDEVKGLVEEWRNRPLEPFYPVLFFNASRVNIHDESHVRKKADI